jgi:putative ABC transport system permease protein
VRVSRVRAEAAIVQGRETAISGIDAATIGHFYRFDWTAGSDAALPRLGDDGALVTEKYALDRKLEVGSQLRVRTASGRHYTVIVRGIHDVPDSKALLAPVSVSLSAFDRAFAYPANSLAFVSADPNAAAALRATVSGLGDAHVHTTTDYAKDASKDLATTMALLYALLGFSVVVSLFGMANTLVLAIFERTREIGMLRAAGMTRRQARMMIRHESVITALIGTAAGLGLGAALAVPALLKSHLPIAIPAATLAAFIAVAVVLGVTAAAWPARRAAGLNVLDALDYE